jgi:hypothetical protein
MEGCQQLPGQTALQGLVEDVEVVLAELEVAEECALPDQAREDQAEGAEGDFVPPSLLGKA